MQTRSHKRWCQLLVRARANRCLYPHRRPLYSQFTVHFTQQSDHSQFTVRSTDQLTVVHNIFIITKEGHAKRGVNRPYASAPSDPVELSDARGQETANAVLISDAQRGAQFGSGSKCEIPVPSISMSARRSDSNVGHVRFDFDAVQENDPDGSRRMLTVDYVRREIRSAQREAFDESLANVRVPELNENSKTFDAN